MLSRSIAELLNACALHFTQGRPCIGYPLPREHRQGGRDVSLRIVCISVICILP